MHRRAHSLSPVATRAILVALVAKKAMRALIRLSHAHRHRCLGARLSLVPCRRCPVLQKGALDFASKELTRVCFTRTSMLWRQMQIANGRFAGPASPTMSAAGPSVRRPTNLSADRPICPPSVHLSADRPICPPSVHLSAAVRSVRRRSICPPTDQFIRRPANLSASADRPICPPSVHLSADRPSVRRRSICPPPVDLSAAGRSVRQPTNLSAADKFVRRPTNLSAAGPSVRDRLSASRPICPPTDQSVRQPTNPSA